MITLAGAQREDPRPRRVTHGPPWFSGPGRRVLGGLRGVAPPGQTAAGTLARAVSVLDGRQVGSHNTAASPARELDNRIAGVADPPLTVCALRAPVVATKV